MPKQLEPGVLYVSEKYGAVAHLCACGCGAKIRTPLGETEWSLKETASGPSLWPSVGNWQQACKSHYVIDGERSYGAAPGRPSELWPVARLRKRVARRITMPCTPRTDGSSASGTGSRDCLSDKASEALATARQRCSASVHTAYAAAR
ncbi:DUF6527 family protein [Bosea vestrisii]|nr:DUF6527 family protein [Bosea vestrisii]WID99529.1 DUF6527 family protein [Bosea vestrisii]